MTKNHFAAIWEAVSDLVPERIAVVQGEREVSWRDYETRSARLAAALLDAGLGPHAKVAIYLYNSPEYAETNFAAAKIRAIPINVNYRYLDDELFYLLENADAEAVVYHRSLGDRIARVAPRLPMLKLLVEVDDEPAAEEPDAARVSSSNGSANGPKAVAYEQIQATFAPAPRIEPQGDEVYTFYTGGTTGMPKGVMYPLVGFTEFFLRSYPQMVGMTPIVDADQLLATVAANASGPSPMVAMSGPPLMHGTGCWLGLMMPHLLGGTAVLLEGRGLDPIEVWSVVERRRVQHLVIVGDAFAKPMLRALEAKPGGWDLTSLQLLISSGAMFSYEVKQGLLEHVPTMAIADVLGSTEGGMGQSIMVKGMPRTDTAKFALSPTTKVFTDDGREVEPGSGEVGMVANGGLVPLGYYKDPEKSARTFREVNGVRYSFPGDMAMVAADGTLELLGRGSNCINTGGEKVFPEEVEEALKVHPAVEDALVFGVPDDKFGNRVVAIASLSPGASAEGTQIVGDARTRLSAYKLPKDVLIVPSVPRAPNGKADYKAARVLYDASQPTG